MNIEQYINLLITRSDTLQSLNFRSDAGTEPSDQEAEREVDQTSFGHFAGGHRAGQSCSLLLLLLSSPRALGRHPCLHLSPLTGTSRE